MLAEYNLIGGLIVLNLQRENFACFTHRSVPFRGTILIGTILTLCNDDTGKVAADNQIKGYSISEVIW